MSNKDNLKNIDEKVVESRLSAFLTNNSKALAFSAIAIVLVVLVFGIVNLTMNKKVLNNIDALETAQTQLTVATAVDIEADSYQSDLDQAVADLEALESKSGYVGLKSTYLLALKSFSEEDYQTALDNFVTISEKASGTYMGSLSLSNAAVCAEQLGDETKTVEYCQQLIDTYGNDAAETPKAMFTLARIYVNKNNSDLAQGQFQQLADQFPNSEYAKLAQNSLLNY
jgi:TolA-binding protein